MPQFYNLRVSMVEYYSCIVVSFTHATYSDVIVGMNPNAT